ncbi:f-box-like domain-containing protein [Phthorimaea operculella]|nr:f-box-like domain-containing protein [Phthorimaea operculella]
MYISIEDSTTEIVPPLLENIVQNIAKEEKCCDSLQKDLLCILIIVLMVENGFYPIKGRSDNVLDPRKIKPKRLKEWKTASGLFEVEFVLNGFETTLTKLVISPLGSTVLVNLVLNVNNLETYSVCLPVSRYVVSPQASTIPMIFRDLKHFSFTLKNKIIAPVKSRILGFHGYPGASLVGLPDEVLYQICLELSVVEAVRLSQTCKRMKFMLENDFLWHEFYKRDFQVVPSSSMSIDTESSTNNPQGERSDWKAMYREKFVAQKEAAIVQRGRTAGRMHDFMDYADYRSYIDNPMWDNMII